MKINKGQFRLSSKTKNFKLEINRGNGHLLEYMINRIRWHLFPRINRVRKFPSHVDIELSSLCNLNCPMCYTTTDEFKSKVNQKSMDLNYLKKLLMNAKNMIYIQLD